MDFKKLVEQYKNLILDDPISRTNSGIHDKDFEVSDLSEKYFEDNLIKFEKLLNKINKMSENELNFDEKIDLDLMKLAIKKIIFENKLKYNNLFDYQQKPILGENLINTFLYLFLKDPRDSKIRLDAINSRLSKIPNMILDYKKVLKKPIIRWKNMEVEELRGINDLFNNILSFAKLENFDKLSEMKINIEKTNNAIENYLKFLNTLETEVDFSIGKEKTQKLVNLNGINLTLNEIFDLSKDFFKNYYIEIEEILKKVKNKYNLDDSLQSLEVIDFIKEKFKLPVDKILKEYIVENENIINFLKKDNYFELPKSHKLKIIQTPKYLVPSIPVGAMFPPAPFENGPKVSLIYLTIDKARQKDQNSLMIKNTMIHEGIPGHHLQFSMGYENGSTVRSLAVYNSHSEGWTTYLEDFMTKINYVDDEIKNEYVLISLSDFARLGARVGIDLYFMSGDENYLNIIENFTPTGNTKFEKAKSLLKKATGFTDARCEGELNWYSRERGYPMVYLIGNQELYKLKNEILSKSSNKVDSTKKFHSIYLKEGTMPLHYLKKILKFKNLI